MQGDPIGHLGIWAGTRDKEEVGGAESSSHPKHQAGLSIFNPHFPSEPVRCHVSYQHLTDGLHGGQGCRLQRRRGDHWPDLFPVGVSGSLKEMGRERCHQHLQPKVSLRPVTGLGGQYDGKDKNPRALALPPSNWWTMDRSLFFSHPWCETSVWKSITVSTS